MASGCNHIKSANQMALYSCYYVESYPRETKKGGAWMNELRSYGISNGELKLLIYVLHVT